MRKCLLHRRCFIKFSLIWYHVTLLLWRLYYLLVNYNSFVVCFLTQVSTFEIVLICFWISGFPIVSVTLHCLIPLLCPPCILYSFPSRWLDWSSL
jgi:hypothetical protein